jgi:hypothetical protein
MPLIERDIPIEGCKGFTPIQKTALRLAAERNLTFKYVQTAAAYNGAITPLTVNVKANKTYKVTALARVSGAGTVTLNTPAVTFLLGRGFADSTTDINYTYVAADPAVVCDAAGSAYFTVTIRPSADGTISLDTSTSLTVNAGSFLEIVDVSYS